jgi:hypothetical protein
LYYFHTSVQTTCVRPYSSSFTLSFNPPPSHWYPPLNRTCLLLPSCPSFFLMYSNCSKRFHHAISHMNILYFDQSNPLSDCLFLSLLPSIVQKFSVHFGMPSSYTDAMYFYIIYSCLLLPLLHPSKSSIIIIMSYMIIHVFSFRSSFHI